MLSSVRSHVGSSRLSCAFLPLLDSGGRGCSSDSGKGNQTGGMSTKRKGWEDYSDSKGKGGQSDGTDRKGVGKGSDDKSKSKDKGGKSDGEDIGGNIDGEVTYRPHKCIRLVLTTSQQTTAYRYEDEQMMQD